jgi:peptidoglycan hydrolase FlgJ
MNVQSAIRNPQSAIETLHSADPLRQVPGTPQFSAQAPGSELKEAFSDFVGQTFFGQLIASMRKTVEKPAYFHGGRAEEVFQGQLDQLLAERISDVSREQFAEPMFELFMMQRPA